MENQYAPISCALHDEYLAAATLRRPIKLKVKHANGQAVEVGGVIVDVYSKAGAEYLKLDNGTVYRLDQIEITL